MSGFTIINSYAQTNLATVAFLTYLSVSAISLIVYTVCFVVVFRNDAPNRRCCCDPLRFGKLTLFVLGIPFLMNVFHLFDAIVGTVGYYQGQDLRCHFAVEIVLGVVVIVNLTTLNYFQLKIAGIAAIQRCETPEQEAVTVERIRLAFWVYLPLYVFLTTV